MKCVLETQRLILRPWRIEDTEPFFHGWATDLEVTKYMTWSPHESIEVTKNLLAMWLEEYEKPERINFAIELKDTSELVGGIDVVSYDEGIPTIGYMLKRDQWNKGYMTEACQCVLKHLFSLGYKSARIEAVAENIGSNKVIQKCGGVLVGTRTREGHPEIINTHIILAK